MTESFQQTEKLRGTVYVDGEELGDCRYEFVYNPYDTNSMEITLFGPPEGMPSAPDMPPVKVITEFSWGRYQMELDQNLAGGRRFNMKESRYMAPVKEFRKEQHFEEETEANEISIGFLFPITSVTEYANFTTPSPAYGYVRGKYDSQEHIFEPLENTFSIESPIGEFNICDEFDFQDEDEDLYPSTRITRRSRLGLNRQVVDSSVERVVESARDAAYNFFHMLSLIERTRINWHTERLLVKSEGGDPVSKTTRHRWVPPPSSNYRPNPNLLPERRRTLDTLLNTYWDCTPERQTDIDDIIDNFKTANAGDTIESKFIHWHSCLDFFKPLYFEDLEGTEKNRVENNMTVSEQLVYLFDEAGIDVEDLLSEDTIAEIREAIEEQESAPLLRPTKLRNEYIHDGFHAFRGIEQEAIDLRRKMRAIGERLLVRYMGIDPSGTSLGQPYHL